MDSWVDDRWSVVWVRNMWRLRERSVVYRWKYRSEWLDSCSSFHTPHYLRSKEKNELMTRNRNPSCLMTVIALPVLV
jgi:hypothetical protein